MSIFSGAYAMEDNYELKSWTPSRLTEEQKNDIKREIEKENHLYIQKNELDKDLDFGISFAGINPAQLECLREISKMYEQNETRPKCADFGAGHGYMTWKMIVAGGDVFAVEPQDPTRAVLIENVKKAIPFLKKEEKIEKISRCNGSSKSGNVLSFDTCPAYRANYSGYDVTWSGNLIHLFRRSEAIAYVENLFKITNKGGYAFATVHTACSNIELLSYFLERKKSGIESPGYFMTNNINYWRQYMRPDPQRHGILISDRSSLTRLEVIPVDADLENSPLSPTMRNIGFYGGGGKKERYDVDNNSKYPYDDGLERFYTYKFDSHNIKYFFDTDSLKSLFEKAGFITEDVFFMDTTNNTRLESPLTLEMAESNQRRSIYVGIKAYKPE